MDTRCEWFEAFPAPSKSDVQLFQLKDLVEDAIEGKLDSTHFPYLSDQRGQAKSQAPAR